MILLVDNYDSFSYNLYQMIGAMDPDIKVLRNDCADPDTIRELKPKCIILSPGPGKPADAGYCEEIVKTFCGVIPIFGVCLGHQAICEAFGAEVGHAKELMHGKQSMVKLDTESVIFSGMPEEIPAARYHSLAVNADTLTEELEVIAATEDGEVMAVQHRTEPVYGLQFHPESIMTPDGKNILKNFLEAIK